MAPSPHGLPEHTLQEDIQAAPQKAMCIRTTLVVFVYLMTIVEKSPSAFQDYEFGA
jgi:hypothetical protein